MDAEIPAQLQHVEIGKVVRALDDQRNREFWNYLGKEDAIKDSKHTTV